MQEEKWRCEIFTAKENAKFPPNAERKREPLFIYSNYVFFHSEKSPSGDFPLLFIAPHCGWIISPI